MDEMKNDERYDTNESNSDANSSDSAEMRRYSNDLIDIANEQASILKQLLLVNQFASLFVTNVANVEMTKFGLKRFLECLFEFLNNTNKLQNGTVPQYIAYLDKNAKFRSEIVWNTAKLMIIAIEVTFSFVFLHKWTQNKAHKQKQIITRFRIKIGLICHLSSNWN